MKKIILFTDNLGSGGAQRQLVNLATMLKERQYDVSVLVYQDTPFYKHYLDEQNIPVILVERPSYIRRLFAIRRYLRRSGANVVITFLETPGFIACFSKIGGAKWKLITSERSAKRRTFINKRHRFFNQFERFADAKVCNSENALRLWKKFYPQWSDKYVTIYNPVDMPASALAAAQEHRRGERLVITVAASYQGLKNPLGVVEAVHQLPADQQNRLKLIWHGRQCVSFENTTAYDKAAALIDKYGLQEVVQLNAETNNIYTVMAQSDAIGLFSFVEGLPNAICEGMMLGKPIIMSRVSDYDILTTGNGVLCDPRSADSIRDALAALLDASEEDMREMGKISHEKATILFSRSRVGDQWVTLIEDL